MQTLAQAIAHRNSARVDIPVIGDSITEGQGATLFADRWTAQANTTVRHLWPTTANGAGGGLGFIPIQATGETTYTWPVTAAGTTGSFDLGPVRYCSDPAAAVTWSWTAPAGTTSVKIMYYDSASGEFSWQVNSGPVTDVTMGGTLADLLTASIPMSGGQVLTISYVSGSFTFVDGIMHYAGDENSGITFHGCGHFGWTANIWNAAEEFSLDWAQCYEVFSPAAIGLFLGVNDAAVGGGDLTAIEFEGSLQALIGTIQSQAPLANVPLLFIIPYQAAETFADPGGWPAYVSAIQNLATLYPNSVVVNLAGVMLPVADSPGYYYDSLHPNNQGHALIGGYVAAAVGPQNTAGGSLADAIRPGRLFPAVGRG